MSVVLFHNLRVNRRPLLVGWEVRQLVADTDRPELVAVCEAWQYPGVLADVPGYRYLSRRGEGPSQRDAGLLVRRDIPVRRFGLVRTRTSWPRAKSPGQHWPRSFPWADVALDGRWTRVVVVHWPRDQRANQLAVAECWVRLLMLLVRTPRPVLAVGDFNQSKRARGPFTPRKLAKALPRGRLFGVGILLAIVRGRRVESAEVLPDQQRASDHPPLALRLRG